MPGVELICKNAQTKGKKRQQHSEHRFPKNREKFQWKSQSNNFWPFLHFWPCQGNFGLLIVGANKLGNSKMRKLKSRQAYKLTNPQADKLYICQAD